MNKNRDSRFNYLYFINYFCALRHITTTVPAETRRINPNNTSLLFKISPVLGKLCFVVVVGLTVVAFGITDLVRVLAVNVCLGNLQNLFD